VCDPVGNEYTGRKVAAGSYSVRRRRAGEGAAASESSSSGGDKSKSKSKTAKKELFPAADEAAAGYEKGEQVLMLLLVLPC